MNSQTSISVRHEDLLDVKTDISTAPGGPPRINHPDRRVTNVPAEYT